MSSGTEVAKDVGAIATAPIGGILIGSSVAPATCSFDGAVTCKNWFGSTMNGWVGNANPELLGFLGGLIILGLASVYVYLHRTTGKPSRP